MRITQKEFLKAIDVLMHEKFDDDHSKQIILDYIKENSDKPELLNVSAPESEKTALTMAITFGYYDIVREIVKIPNTVNAQDGSGFSPLTCAASRTAPFRAEMLEMLLNVTDIEINKTDGRQKNALMYAIYHLNTIAVDILLSHGAQLAYDNVKPFILLHEAIGHHSRHESSCQASKSIFTKLASHRKEEKLSDAQEMKNNFQVEYESAACEAGLLTVVQLLQDAGHVDDLVHLEIDIKNYLQNYINTNKNGKKLYLILQNALMALMRVAIIYRNESKYNDICFEMLTKKCDLLWSQTEFIFAYELMLTCKEGRIPESLMQGKDSINNIVQPNGYYENLFSIGEKPPIVNGAQQSSGYYESLFSEEKRPVPESERELPGRHDDEVEEKQDFRVDLPDSSDDEDEEDLLPHPAFLFSKSDRSPSVDLSSQISESENAPSHNDQDCPLPNISLFVRR